MIEDDATTGPYVVSGLREEGHTADLVTDGRAGLLQATAADYDVLVIDRMLPGLDGLSLIKTLRGAGVRTPAIMLTALSGVDDRIDGLEAGGG